MPATYTYIGQSCGHPEGGALQRLYYKILEGMQISKTLGISSWHMLHGYLVCTFTAVMNFTFFIKFVAV
jgi:hypothetical protein